MLPVSPPDHRRWCCHRSLKGTSAAVEEWLPEPPDSADAALALVHSAGILAADRFDECAPQFRR
jgi:hypothetical protein